MVKERQGEIPYETTGKAIVQIVLNLIDHCFSD